MGEIKAKRGSWRKWGAAVVALAIMALLPACSSQKKPEVAAVNGPAKVTAIKAESGDQQDLVSITIEPATTPYSITKGSEPAKVMIDVPNAVIAGVPGTIPVADGYIQEIEVREIKSSANSSPTVRVILNLKQAMEFTSDRTNGPLVVALDRRSVTPVPDLFPSAAGTVLVQGDTGAITPAEDWAWGGASAVPAPTSPHVPVAGQGRNIKDISVSAESDLSRINVVMDGGVGDYSAFVLEAPARLVVDMWGLKAPRNLEQKNLNTQGIAKVRVGNHPDKVRLVFDATGKMPYYRFDKSGDRLVITFSRSVNVSASPESTSAATSAAGAATSGGNDWPVMAVAAAEDEWAGPQSGSNVEPAGSGITPVAPVEGPAITAPSSAVPASSSPALDWGPAPGGAPVMAESGRVGIAYIDSIKFDYSNDSSSIIIHSDRPIRRDQWSREDNPDENIVSIFISGAQVAADQQRSYDTTEFSSPVELFSVFQRPTQANEVAIIIVMRHEAASKWSQADSKLVFQFENAPGTLGLAGASTQGMFGPNGEQLTGGAAVPGGSGQVGAPEGGMGQYSGAAISLDFKNMDILDALRTIAEVSGVNMVVSDDVKGKITIKLENVPWDQALDLILQTKNLGKVETGNIMRIAPKNTLEREKADRLRALENERKYEEMMIKIIPVNYLKADDLRRVVTPMLTPGRGKADSYKRTNSLIIRDIPKVVAEVEETVRRLDHPTKQVIIEARIVEATVGVTRQLGVSWGTNVNVGSGTGYPTGLNFPNSVQIGGATMGSPAPAAASAAGRSMGGGALGMTVGSLNNAVDLDVLLRALEATEKIKIISSPRVVTITDEKATIQQGVSIPYPPPSYTAGTVGWTFVQASLELEVTPHVSADNSIVMEVRAANNEPVTIAGSDRPGISRKEAQTTILLKDGETAVIGGIFKIKKTEPETRVPWLGSLPWIGFLFRDKVQENRNEELIIFLTPQIINPGSSINESITVGGGGR